MSQTVVADRSLPADPAPYFRVHLFACTNKRDGGKKACGDSGAEALRGYLKDKAKALGLQGVRINSAGCLDRCGHGPVLVIYPEGVWYAYRTQADLDEILDTHIVRGGRVARLMLKPEQKE